MASQIAPELEENIKDYIQKTMKEVKKKPKILKQTSKDDHAPNNTNSVNNVNTNEFLPPQNYYISKPQTAENLMEIEEEKAPMKSATTTSISINHHINEAKPKEDLLTNNNVATSKDKKRNSLNEFEDIKKIETLLRYLSPNLLISKISKYPIYLNIYM